MTTVFIRQEILILNEFPRGTVEASLKKLLAFLRA